MKKALLSLIFITLIAGTARADLNRYIYDPAHTQIFFSVNHLGFSFSTGRFNAFSGDFTFDPAQVEKSQVNATIDINSLDMASDEWDTHLKGKDFFNAEKFPQMAFKSTKVEKTGEKTGKLTGDLTLLGVTKPVTLDVTWNGSGPHPMTKNMIAGFSANGSLKRSDFGMTYGLGMVGDDIKIMINVEGIRQDFDKIQQ